MTVNMLSEPNLGKLVYLIYEDYKEGKGPFREYKLPEHTVRHTRT